MNKNIVLIGFMGTGKSEVGKKLAERLDYEYIDTDELIEVKVGSSISEIFNKYGELYFRKIESEVIEEVASRSKVVISTGGGAVIRQENMENLKSNGIMICLTATPAEIYKRTASCADRPLLIRDDPCKKIKELMKEREAYYSQAGITIDTTKLEVTDVVDRILKEVETYNG